MAEITHNLESLKKAQLDWSLEAKRRAEIGCFEIQTGVQCGMSPRSDDVLARAEGTLHIKKWGVGHIEFEYNSDGRERVVGGTVQDTAKLLVARLRRDADLIEKYFTNESTNQG